MKKALLFLILFVTTHSFAQTSYFVDKKGQRTFIEDGTWDIILIDKRVSYKLPHKTWEKYITFGDLDYGIFGRLKFKSFKIDGKKKAYFVITEANGKSLLTLSVTTTVSSGSMSSSNTYYHVLVVDNTSKVLASVDFHDYKNKSAADARGQVAGMIKSQFPDCPTLIADVEAADTNDEMKFGILEFLNTPIFRDCN